MDDTTHGIQVTLADLIAAVPDQQSVYDADLESYEKERFALEGQAHHVFNVLRAKGEPDENGNATTPLEDAGFSDVTFLDIFRIISGS